MANELTPEERVAEFQERLDRLCRAHNVYLQAGASTIIVWDVERDHPLDGVKLGTIDKAGYGE